MWYAAAVMWPDVVDLRDFYATSLGRVARRTIRNRVRGVWPDVRGMAVLGLGYATPYLDPFRPEAGRVLAAMPAAQGVLHWPREGSGLVSLVDEFQLPLADLSIDRVLLVHALENSEHRPSLMREVWRVLKESGRLLVVVPNRRGLWARFERTPFGNGEPFSPAQLTKLLRECMFTPLCQVNALHVPPLRSRMVMSSAAAWETVGEKGFNSFAGVVIVEATKQIYAATPIGVTKRKRAYLPVPKRVPRVSARASGPTRSARPRPAAGGLDLLSKKTA